MLRKMCIFFTLKTVKTFELFSGSIVTVTSLGVMIRVSPLRGKSKAHLFKEDLQNKARFSVSQEYKDEESAFSLQI